MDKRALEAWLAQGLSLEAIGALVDRDPSTVGYWVRKHGLKSAHSDLTAPIGPIPRARLEALVAAGASARSMASALGRSESSVRHWLAKYDLRTTRGANLQQRRASLVPGAEVATAVCHRHGTSRFKRRQDGAYRCMRCASEAVARRRRRVKEILVQEGGGRCGLCGYDRYAGALHFHHLDPKSKAFALSHQGVTIAIAKVRAEAAKCTLLCSNCHAEVEAGIAALPSAPDQAVEEIPSSRS